MKKLKIDTILHDPHNNITSLSFKDCRKELYNNFNIGEEISVGGARPLDDSSTYSCWVSNEQLKNSNFVNEYKIYFDKFNMKGMRRAQLIVEPLEPEINISRSEFEDAWDDARNDPSTFENTKERLLSKLFKDK